jgi:hypothetical protein
VVKLTQFFFSNKSPASNLWARYGKSGFCATWHPEGTGLDSQANEDSYFNIPAQTQLRKTGGITNPIFFLPNLRHVTYGLGMGRGGFVLPGIRKTLASTIRRSARSFSVFCLIKANDNKTCLRNTQASSGDRLLVRPSKSQFTSNKCMSLCAKQPLQLMQFTAEPYKQKVLPPLTRIERGNTNSADTRIMRQLHVEVLP